MSSHSRSDLLRYKIAPKYPLSGPFHHSGVGRNPEVAGRFVAIISFLHTLVRGWCAPGGPGFPGGGLKRGGLASGFVSGGSFCLGAGDVDVGCCRAVWAAGVVCWVSPPVMPVVTGWLERMDAVANIRHRRTGERLGGWAGSNGLCSTLRKIQEK